MATHTVPTNLNATLTNSFQLSPCPIRSIAVVPSCSWSNEAHRGRILYRFSVAVVRHRSSHILNTLQVWTNFNGTPGCYYISKCIPMGLFKDTSVADCDPTVHQYAPFHLILMLICPPAHMPTRPASSTRPTFSNATETGLRMTGRHPNWLPVHDDPLERPQDGEIFPYAPRPCSPFSIRSAHFNSRHAQISSSTQLCLLLLPSSMRLPCGPREHRAPKYAQTCRLCPLHVSSSIG